MESRGDIRKAAGREGKKALKSAGNVKNQIRKYNYFRVKNMFRNMYHNCYKM